jgi:hypothetical protein
MARPALPLTSARKPALVLAFLLTAFLLLQCAVRLSTTIQIGADEGFELAKATLCLKGYRLYTDVWNDQPPLHTFIITQVLKHISPSILGPRLVTTAFTILLLSSVFFMSLRVSGLLVAALTTALIIASPGFLELASLCMLEIPALATAIAGLFFLLGPEAKDASAGAHPSPGAATSARLEVQAESGASRRSGLPAPEDGGTPLSNWGARELLAGAVFGAALMIKLVDIYMLPLVMVVLWVRLHETEAPAAKVDSRSSTRRKEALTSATKGLEPPDVGCYPSAHGTKSALPFMAISRSLLIFIASLAATCVAIDFLIENGAYLLHFRQSWASHFGPTKTLAYGSANDHLFDWGVLLRNWDVTIPAVAGIGVFASSFRKQPAMVLPLAWLVLSLLVFTIHRPWWAYYYVHNAVPLCWCAAGGIAALIERARLRRSRVLGAAIGLFAACALSWSASRVYFQIREVRYSPQTFSSLVLGEIERLKPWSEWMYADQQIYSFHTGIPMPPDLAVLVLKRFWAGEMDNDRITDELRKFKPGVILLANDARAVPFKDLLNEEYQVIYQDGYYRLYALKAMLKARKTALSPAGQQ